jgi:putative transcriptional regulator
MVMNHEIQELLQNSYHALLLAYAAGALDEAQHLIVSSHIAISPTGRRFVHTCEAVGGTLIEKHCEPVPMKNCSLGKVLDKISSACSEKSMTEKCASGKCNFPDKLNMPEPLARTVSAQPKPPQWRRITSGIQAIELELACKNSHSRFVKLEPGRSTPHHRHDGPEITLVLNGAFADESGQYRRGDLVVVDEQFRHTQQACNRDGCIALVVSTTPIRLTGIAALFNPFIRI